MKGFGNFKNISLIKAWNFYLFILLELKFTDHETIHS